MKVKVFFILLMYSICLFPQIYNPKINEIVNQVSIDSLIKHVRILSGEDSLALEDSTYWIISRASNAHFHETLGHRVAAKYIIRNLRKYCPDVIEQTFLFRNIDTVRNIIGIQVGARYPEKKIIISGHYDSILWDWDNSIAPGADDNASGVAAVLETARILKNYELDNTILYILWDWEEDGGVGSSNFCQNYGYISDVIAMLNFDMIGYDILDTGLVSIYHSDDRYSYNLGLTINNIINLYNLKLTSILHNEAVGGDCVAFWAYGICPAIHVSECYFDNWEYRNPYYHTVDDKIECFNLSYFDRVAKLAIATTAELGFNGMPTSINNRQLCTKKEYSLFQNYPNPFNAMTNISYTLSEDSDITLSILNLQGELVKTLLSEHQQAGSYVYPFYDLSLASGVYFYRIECQKFIQIKKMVLLK